MTKKVIGFVRYSVLVGDSGGFAIRNRTSRFEDYRAAIFDPDRLAFKRFLFGSVTLPSIAAQSIDLDPEWFRLVILTAEDLPEAERKALEHLVAPYPWVRIVPLPVEERIVYTGASREIDRFCEPGDQYACFRIDDDDGVGRYFVEDLLSFVRPELDGFCVTLSAGYLGYVDTKKGKLVELYTSYSPNVSAGLACIGIRPESGGSRDIFSAGSHRELDQLNPVISYAHRPSYLKVLHLFGGQYFGRNARKRKKRGKKYRKEAATVEQVKEYVSFDDQLIP